MRINRISSSFKVGREKNKQFEFVTLGFCDDFSPFSGIVQTKQLIVSSIMKIIISYSPKTHKHTCALALNFKQQKAKGQGEMCHCAEFLIERYYATGKALPIKWCGMGATTHSQALPKDSHRVSHLVKCSSGVDS